MLHLPCYILSGLLGLMLVIREYQNNRIHEGLIDKILESRGMTGIPDEHPLVDAVKSLAGDAKEPLTTEQKRLMKNARERVTFKIPNMPKMGSNY